MNIIVGIATIAIAAALIMPNAFADEEEVVEEVVVEEAAVEAPAEAKTEDEVADEA